MTLDESLAWLATQRPDMEALLAELVNVNSGTANVRGVERCQQRLEAVLAELPLEVKLHAPKRDGFGPHLTFRTPALAHAKGPLLVGHMDTVFPPGTFEGYRADGVKAFGPGVLDMKGGLVVVTWALSALTRAGRLARLPLGGVVVSDEEVGSPDSTALTASLCERATVALGFESGRANDLVITRRKGTGAVKAEAAGKAAHAGNLHHQGVNAIWAIAKFVDAAQRLTDYGRGITVNVGRVSGGTSKNTVPDSASCELDFRFTSLADAEWVERALLDAAAEAMAAVPGSRITLSGGRSRPPLERSEASAALYRAYAACQKAVGLGDGEAPLLGGGSDAATTSAQGVASIDGLGPRGTGFHTVEEQIELATLVTKSQALVRYLWSPAEP